MASMMQTSGETSVKLCFVQWRSEAKSMCEVRSAKEDKLRLQIRLAEEVSTWKAFTAWKSCLWFKLEMQAIEYRFEQQICTICDESENKGIADVLDERQLLSLTFSVWRSEFFANDRWTMQMELEHKKSLIDAQLGWDQHQTIKGLHPSSSSSTVELTFHGLGDQQQWVAMSGEQWAAPK